MELKQLIALSSKMHLSIGQRLGRWDAAFTDEERNVILRETEDLMNQAGLTEQEIRNIKVEAWDRGVHAEYVTWALAHVSVLSHPVEELVRLQNLSQPAAPDEVEAFLKHINQWTPEAQTIIGHYRCYMASGQHADPAAWAQRRHSKTSD